VCCPSTQRMRAGFWGSAPPAAVIWCEQDGPMTAVGFRAQRHPPGFAAAPGRCLPRLRGGPDPAHTPAGADPETGQTKLADYAFFYGESKLHGAAEDLANECRPRPRRAASLATIHVRAPGWRAGCSLARIPRGPGQRRPSGTCELDVSAYGQGPAHRHTPPQPGLPSRADSGSQPSAKARLAGHRRRAARRGGDTT
jgi:hypothetical protein